MKKNFAASIKASLLYLAASFIVLAFFTIFNCFAFAQVYEDWILRPSNVGLLALDGCGNFYILSGDSDNGTGSDLVTIKYDKDGNQIWKVRYNGPIHGDDIPVKIEVDQFGCVYVTGSSPGPDTNDDGCFWSDADFVTIKYDPDGNELWVNRYNGPSKGGDFPDDLLIDADENVYVAGTSYKYSTCFNTYDHVDVTDYWDFVTIKYDRNGNKLWEKIFEASQHPNANAISLKMGPDKNLYLLGWYNNQIATIKYDKQGNEIWMRSDPGRRPAFIAFDNNQNAIMAAFIFGNCPLYKFSLDGELLWSKWTGTKYNLVGLIISSDNSIYLGGSHEEEETNVDYELSKLDLNGNKIWDVYYNGITNLVPPNDVAKGMVSDSFGNIYITGTRTIDRVAYGMATVKYDSNGNVVWTLIGSEEQDSSVGIELDILGKIYVGAINYMYSGSEYLLTKYSQSNDGSIYGEDYPECPVYLPDSQDSPINGDGQINRRTSSSGGSGCFISAVSPF